MGQTRAEFNPIFPLLCMWNIQNQQPTRVAIRRFANWTYSVSPNKANIGSVNHTNDGLTDLTDGLYAACVLTVRPQRDILGEHVWCFCPLMYYLLRILNKKRFFYDCLAFAFVFRCCCYCCCCFLFSKWYLNKALIVVYTRAYTPSTAHITIISAIKC